MDDHSMMKYQERSIGGGAITPKNTEYDVLIVGAGISGCTIAERMSAAGKTVLLIDKREHIGGNCYDHFNEHGILVQKYGPHIFHTKNKRVWDYLNRFTRFNDYRHKVVARYKDELYPIPINRTTFNKFYGLNLDEEGMKTHLERIREKIPDIKNSRDVVVSKLGVELYDAFVKDYTKKQWDCYPEDLSPEVLQRLPIRYDDNDQYFNDPHQGIPVEGYTKMFERMIDSPNITVLLDTDYRDVLAELEYGMLVCTAPIDAYFDYKFDRLPYRALEFHFETHDREYFQENSVVNYPGLDVPYTRITEFKYFLDQEILGKTTILKEVATWEGEPSYPVPKPETKKIVAKYQELAAAEKGVHFLGRLGRYKYLDMDAACAEALELADELLGDVSATSGVPYKGMKR